MPVISSSAIKFADYKAEAKELSITFSSGRTYTYFNVPLSIYDGLIGAQSPGRFYNDYIKDKYGEA